MRPLECLLSLANVLAVVKLAIPRLLTQRWTRLLAPVALLAGVLQVVFEGFRWQLVPAYVLAGIITLVWILRRGTRTVTGIAAVRPNRLVLGLGAGLGSLSLLLSIGLPLLFPVFSFPAPSGPYQIGTLTYHWVDDSRHEAFSADPAARRELMVQLWYPAHANPASRRARYVADARVFGSMARLLRLPAFMFAHFRDITTNAFPAAAVSDRERTYPVLVFSHGRGGYRQHNTFQVEELVSHGYVVAAIDHPYAATGVVFPDGREVRLDPRMMDRRFEDGIIPFLAQDAVFTLNQLSALNRADPNGVLAGRLDLQRVGIFGVSLGGEVGAEACRQDARFRALLSMDTWMPPSVVESGLEQPSMWITRDAASMRRERWTATDIDRTLRTMRSVFERKASDGYFLQVPGMFHQDFSDAALFSPATSLIGVTGPINGARARAIVNAYSVAFFDRYLKGLAEPLLEGASPSYPDVLFEHR